MSVYKIQNDVGIQLNELFIDSLNTGIGVFSGLKQRLEVDGAIRLGEATLDLDAGTIQWNGTHFQGYDGFVWVNLDDGIEYTADNEGLTITTSNEFTLVLDGDSLVKSTSGLKVEPLNISISEFAPAEADISMDGFVIRNAGEPTLNSDVTNKEYVDRVAGGGDYKESCRLATTGQNINFTNAPNYVDATAVTYHSRILVKDQIDPRENGIYYVNFVGTGLNGVWSRAVDHNGNPTSEISGGNITFIEQGIENAGTGWVIVGDGVRIVGVNNIVWVKFTANGQDGGGILYDEQNLTPNPETGSIYSTGIFIGTNPLADTHIIIYVNGKIEGVSYGTTDGVFFFSNDGGLTSRMKADIVAGDELFFNSITAEYNLSVDDSISLIYTKFQYFS